MSMFLRCSLPANQATADESQFCWTSSRDKGMCDQLNGWCQVLVADRLSEGHTTCMGLLKNTREQMAAFVRSRTVSIAVAGLSRSGKTAFITSAIANLEAAGRSTHGARWLRGLGVIDTGRLQSARRPTVFRTSHGRAFPHADMLAALSADEPRWPARTADLYEAAVDVRFWPGRKPTRPDAPAATLRIIFVDYPGEWLVDVPLVRQDYADWSRSMLNRMSSKPWSDLAQDYLGILTEKFLAGENDDAQAVRLAQAWQTVLVTAQARGLKWLQPGQFVRRRGQPETHGTPLMDEQALWFCPLPPDVIQAAGSGSLARAMNHRYTAYQKGVQQFFSNTLRECSRHVLLVDVLDALAEGQHGFHETAQVLSAVYAVLADARGGWLRAISGRGGFERVHLLATKSDSVPSSQRKALASLLREMCAGTVAGAAGIARPEASHVAAVRATVDIEHVSETGEDIQAVQGVCADRGKQVRVTGVNIPETLPNAEFFRARQGQRVPQFVPPRVEHGGWQGVPNARLGQVLEDLLGDRLA